MGYITLEGLKLLDQYKYKPGKYTVLDQWMNAYWEFCVSLVPLWVAPNVLTLIGFCLVIASYANMLRYDYTLKEELPSSSFFFTAFCLFSYSTLDAIDGKQARRTRSGSPLGQLFDHGCDSLSLTFFMLAICQATKIDKDQIFMMFIATQIIFWASIWSQYHTGILRTNFGQLGVTESLYFFVLVQLLTGFYGQDFWKITASDILPQSILQVKYYHPILNHILTQKLAPILIHGSSIVIFFLVIYVLVSTLLVAHSKVQAICELLSMLLIVSMQVIWSKFEIFQPYKGIILTNFGLMGSFIISKIIICTVTKMKFKYFHFELIPLMLTTFIMIVIQKINISLQVEIFLFWICFMTDIILILQFLYKTISQITQYLGINCFSLKKRPKKIA